MTTTPKYLETDWEGCIKSSPEYNQMEFFCNVLAEVVRYQEGPYDDGGFDTSFMCDDVLIDTDRWVHEDSEESTKKAILSFYETTEDALDAWIEDHVEVAHWIVNTTQYKNCEFPELDRYILDYALGNLEEEED